MYTYCLLQGTSTLQLFEDANDDFITKNKKQIQVSGKFSNLKSLIETKEIQNLLINNEKTILITVPNNINSSADFYSSLDLNNHPNLIIYKNSSKRFIQVKKLKPANKKEKFFIAYNTKKFKTWTEKLADKWVPINNEISKFKFVGKATKIKKKLNSTRKNNINLNGTPSEFFNSKVYSYVEVLEPNLLNTGSVGVCIFTKEKVAFNFHTFFTKSENVYFKSATIMFDWAVANNISIISVQDKELEKQLNALVDEYSRNFNVKRIVHVQRTKNKKVKKVLSNVLHTREFARYSYTE